MWETALERTYGHGRQQGSSVSWPSESVCSLAVLRAAPCFLAECVELIGVPQNRQILVFAPLLLLSTVHPSEQCGTTGDVRRPLARPTVNLVEGEEAANSVGMQR